jgi:predicted thioredoxin/glutaredoxin
VAERLGHPQDTALTLGRFVTGSMARRLGIMDEAQETVERRVRAAVTEPWLRTRSVRGRVGLRRFRLTCQRMHQAERMTPLLSILNTPI